MLLIVAIHAGKGTQPLKGSNFEVVVNFYSIKKPYLFGGQVHRF